MHKDSKRNILPVFFGFFVMGFADVVGISTSYVKQDFNLTDSAANLLPMMVFLWFAVFSVPTSMLMNKIGRKKTVIISLCTTFLALLIPLIEYRFSMVLFAFALLGIGNTILQVSLNPLLTNVVSGEKLTSSLTLGQFVKAIASFLGPVIAGVASSSFGNWKMMFPVFALITLISGLWLLLTPVKEDEKNTSTSSFYKSFSLLKDPVILTFFLAILLLVGIDVGLNTTLPKFLIERTNMTLEKAGLGTSLYFAARTVGTFVGAILLIKFSGRKFYIGSMILGVFAMFLMIFVTNIWSISILIFCLGLALANVFSIIFSAALKRVPQRANEVSGLLIMGVAGGAVVPPIMGVVSDSFGQIGAMVVLMIAMAYLLVNSIQMKEK
ncbi:MAG: MFS transporter [Labilibaculum sp.]|nr:MFS transporter [Labilibaculum sp.]